jgi:hypothetical protein
VFAMLIVVLPTVVVPVRVTGVGAPQLFVTVIV